MINNLLYHKQNKKKRAPFHSNTVKQIYEDSQLKQLCSSSDYCAMVFLNGTDTKENRKHFNEFIEKMEIMAANNKYKAWNFGWINSACQNELASKFNIKDNGGVIVYQQWKQVYARFAFPTDDLQLVNFFEKLLDNKFVSHKLKPEELFMVKKDCLNAIKKTVEEKEYEEKKERELIAEEKKKVDPLMKTDL